MKKIAIILLMAVLSVCSTPGNNVLAETSSQKEAATATSDYLNTMAFSKSGLTEMLTYEGYSKTDIDYAIKQSNIDWNQQAKKSAIAYIKSMPFSKKGLTSQLRYDGFTKAQAKYGVKKCKANWKKQAKRMGILFLRIKQYSRSKLYKKLKKVGFTKSQAKYGAKAAKKSYDPAVKPANGNDNKLKLVDLSKKEKSELVNGK